MYKKWEWTRHMGPFTRVIDASGRRTHQSTATNHLVVPSVNPSSIGSRVFPVVPVSPIDEK